MKRKIWGISLALFAGAALVLAAATKPIRVGVYDSPGAGGILDFLKTDPRFQATRVTDLSENALFGFDVVVLGSVKGLPREEWERALDVYARCGGGVLLCHDATGFRGWEQPLFPSLFKGVDRLPRNEAIVTAKNHPLAAGLPESFAHGYSDHIVLEKRSDGEVILKDAENNPLVIAGKIGRGKVVGCGMIIGYKRTEKPGFEGEAPPEGGEAKFLLNALAWLASPPLSATPEAALKKLRLEANNQLTLEEAARVIKDSNAGNNAGPIRTAWFCDETLNERQFPLPPVTELKGRQFMFDGGLVSFTSRGGAERSYAEVKALLEQLKYLGVTDIIAQTGGPFNLRYRTKVADVNIKPFASYFKSDYLETLEKACAETGLNCWAMWHSLVFRGGKAPDNLKKYVVRDAKGEPYGTYGLSDVLSPDYMAKAREVIDELAARYNPHGGLKGILLDEFWHPFTVDRMGDNVDDFVAYCRETYKEGPPADIAKKMESRWQEPDNIWWRRYILWRSIHVVKFYNEITRYANSKGLQVITQPLFTLEWRDGWFWGFGDIKGMTRSGDMVCSYAGHNSELYELQPAERMVLGNHTLSRGGEAMTNLVNGRMGFHFAFERLWEPISGALNPRILDVYRRQVLTNRLVYGAEPVTDAALLVNGPALELSFKDANKIFAKTVRKPLTALQSSFKTYMILIDDTEYYGRFKTLIAPKYTLDYLPMAIHEALLDFVRNGGQLIVLDTDANVSNPDHSDKKDLTRETLGLRRGEKPSTASGKILFSDSDTPRAFDFGEITVTEVIVADSEVKTIARLENKACPLVTERALGKGWVVSVNFDIAALFDTATTTDTAAAFLNALMERQAIPAVRFSGDLRAVNVVKKGNWVIAALLPKDGKVCPVRGKLFIDAKALGLKSPSGEYRVFSLAREREMFPQGKNWNLQSRFFWKAADLAKNGVGVYIAPDSMGDYALNPSIDCPWKNTNDAALVQKVVVEEWRRKAASRDYAHEIIAIAPAEEFAIPR